MTQAEYLQSRVEDQINWYDRKSSRSKRAYLLLRVCSVIVALAIPVLSGLLTEANAAQMKLTLGIAGAFVALCEALLTLYKFHDNWTNYRNATEGLKQHKFLFETKAAPYGGTDAFPLFVQNAESIMAGERIQWLKQNTSPEEPPKKPEEAQQEEAQPAGEADTQEEPAPAQAAA